MKFTQIPADTFQQLQMNAGILVDSFTPSSGTIGNIIGATTGGVTFTATPEFVDFGEDVDNCPKNMKELKKQQSIEATLSGTFVTLKAATAAELIGAADVDGDDATHIIPRKDLEDGDFKDVWWIGDYSNLNGATNGGYCAVHLKNALSTGGFQITSTDNGKGQFAFTYTAHYSMDAQDEPPFEIFIKTGTAE